MSMHNSIRKLTTGRRKCQGIFGCVCFLFACSAKHPKERINLSNCWSQKYKYETTGFLWVDIGSKQNWYDTVFLVSACREEGAIPTVQRTTVVTCHMNVTKRYDKTLKRKNRVLWKCVTWGAWPWTEVKAFLREWHWTKWPGVYFFWLRESWWEQEKNSRKGKRHAHRHWEAMWYPSGWRMRWMLGRRDS